MDKLNMQTPDLTDKNIERIAELFPNVITETRDENGALKKAVDFDLLKTALSKDVVEGDDERYRLDWPGKKASLLKANTPITQTLRPCREESVNFDTTENLYIEGDNFEVLKILQESYLGKIKIIYIDPPYNTGRDFIYKDNFKVSKDDYEEELGVENEEGEKLFKNTDSNGRFHSDWLSMMHERLIVARDLLKEDGVIFISIDDTEVHNLRKICDEIFGEDNFFADLVVIRSEGGGLAKRVVKGHDNLLVYVRSLDAFNGIYKPKDIRGKIITKDNREYWIEEDWLRKEFGKYGTCLYEEIEEIKGSDKKQEIDEGIKKDIYRLIKKENGHIVGRLRALDEDGSKFYSILKHLNKSGIKALEELKLSQYFDFPKPLSLIKELVLGATIFTAKENEIILDFFSGSATTAQATLQLNAEDGGNRKFIMVQLPEQIDETSEAFKAGYKTIVEIGKERIRRAGKKIVDEFEAKNQQLELGQEPVDASKLDIGFRVYKTDTSNMKDVFYHPASLDQQQLAFLESNIKEDRTPEDLLTQVLLDLGLELSLPIETKKIGKNTVFIVQTNALVACFDNDIDFKIVDEIAGLKPFKVVFKDASFKDDKDLINVEERFKRLSPETKVTVI